MLKKDDKLGNKTAYKKKRKKKGKKKRGRKKIEIDSPPPKKSARNLSPGC